MCCLEEFERNLNWQGLHGHIHSRAGREDPRHEVQTIAMYVELHKTIIYPVLHNQIVTDLEIQEYQRSTKQHVESTQSDKTAMM